MMHLAKTLFVRVKARRSLIALPAAVLLLTMSGLAAQADSIVFNFNDPTLLPYNTSTQTASPSNTNNSLAVTNYMNSLLGTAGHVTVTGATASGSPTNAGYSGEGYVVCTSATVKSNCISDTLATEYKTPFLMTNSSAPYNSDNSINMAFTGGIQVSSVTFAFEIFPDNTCPDADTCATMPDFTFTMTNTNGLTVDESCTVSALEPGSAPTTTGPLGCATGTIASLVGGPGGSANTNSANSASEASAQYLGTMTLSFASVTNPTLHFQDWPATIGIANLTIGTPPTKVPEPSSLAMLASGLIGIGIARRRRRRAASA